MTKDSNTTVKGYKNAVQSIGYAAAYPLNPPLSWLNGQLSIIASSRRPMLSGVCDCMLVFALPVNILSIVCRDIIHSYVINTD